MVRGPAAIPFISRNTCSDSIAKLCGAFLWNIARYVVRLGIAKMFLPKTKGQGSVSHHFGGVLTCLKRYRALWGIAAIVSQYRAIWGHQASMSWVAKLKGDQISE